MAIMGGAILPKLMGAVGDKYDISRAFIVPLAIYGFSWAELSNSGGVRGLVSGSGH